MKISLVVLILSLFNFSVISQELKCFPYIDNLIIDDIFFANISRNKGMSQKEFYSKFNNTASNYPLEFSSNNKKTNFTYCPVGHIITADSSLYFVFSVREENLELELWIEQVFISSSKNLVLGNTFEIGRRKNHYKLPRLKSILGSIILDEKIFQTTYDNDRYSTSSLKQDKTAIEKFLMMSELLVKSWNRKYSVLKTNVNFHKSELFTLKDDLNMFESDSLKSIKFVDAISIEKNERIILFLIERDDHYSFVELIRMENNKIIERKVISELVYGYEGQLADLSIAEIKKSNKKLTIKTYYQSGETEFIEFKR